MSETATKAKTLQEHAAELPHRVFKPGALTIVLTLAVGGALALGGVAFAQSTMKTTVDGGVAPLRARSEQLEVQVQQLQLDVDQLRRQAAQKEERDAARFDLLYRTILTGRPQPEAAELAAPARDGGR